MSVFVLIFSIATWANFEIPGFELVYTAPVETKLTAPDLRAPADVWVEMIDAAKKKIDLGELYIFSGGPDEPLEKVIKSLEAASARGVKIRMFSEKKMDYANDKFTIDRLKKMKNFE